MQLSLLPAHVMLNKNAILPAVLADNDDILTLHCGGSYIA